MSELWEEEWSDDGHSVENEKKEGNESKAGLGVDSGLWILDWTFWISTEGRDGDRMDIAFFADFNLSKILVSGPKSVPWTDFVGLNRSRTDLDTPLHSLPKVTRLRRTLYNMTPNHICFH